MGAVLGGAILAWTGGQAFAAEGVPEPWQLGLQDAVTPVMHDITQFHTWMLWLITIITLFVLLLLLIVMIKFNAKANPTPSKTTHNTTIEVVWTVAPILILLLIAVPSFRLLYLQRDIPQADMTIKATGHQWYWSYEYPDHDELGFDALMVEEEDLKPGQPRLLATDNDVVVPVNKTVRVIVTASDVIHNWAVPSFGIKMDGIPGRLKRNMVPRRKDRRLLRPMLGVVRHSPRLHADHCPCRFGRGFRRLAGRGEKRNSRALRSPQRSP